MSKTEAIFLASLVIATIVLLWQLLPKSPFKAAAIGLALSWLSLLFAYGFRTTNSWRIVYGKGFGSEAPAIGGFVEAARSLFLAVTLFYIIGTVFRHEMRNLFRRWRDPKWWVARVVFCTVTTLVCYKVIQYHLDLTEAPSFLSHDSRLPFHVLFADQLAWEKEYAIPYRWYLTYSLVIYIFIAVPLLVAPVLSYFRNVRQAKRTITRLEKLLENIGDIRRLQNVFSMFRKKCEGTTRGFLDLLACISFVFAFDYVAGNRTLNARAIYWSWFAASILACLSIAIITVGFFYDGGYRIAHERMLTLKRLDSRWEKENQPVAFLSSLFRTSTGGVLVLSVFLPLLWEIAKKVLGFK